jgi:hypothetical protein
MSSSIQDRMKMAINATAEQISADTIPPLRDLKPARRWFGGRLLPGAQGGSPWLAPVAAAVAIVLIAVAAFVISALAASHPRPVQPTGAAPPYYAEVTLEGPYSNHAKVDITIRSTTTGKVLATVPSPAPGFVPRSVTAAADDRTFVMVAVKSKGISEPDALGAPMRFYRLRFDPATDQVSVSGLPIRDVTAGQTFSMALSPDGRSLAVVTGTFHGIRVYSVPGGGERLWTTSPDTVALDPAWAGGTRTLAFFFDPTDQGGRGLSMRLLDTTSRNKNLAAASRARRSVCLPTWYSPSPSMIMCAIDDSAHHANRADIVEVSLRTGKIVRRLPVPGVFQQGDTPPVVWANPAATKVIVLISRSKPGSFGSVSAYLVTSHGIKKLPGATWPDQLSLYLAASW